MGLLNILAPRQQVQTAAGSVLAGGKVFLFEPGTTTFVSSFRDSGLVTPNTNPVRLSGSGRANIWITRDVDMFIVPRTNVSDLIPSSPVISELNANPDALGADEAGGLVPNGSFEIDTDADLVPDGYTLASEAGAVNALDTSESTDGAQSFRFTSSGVGGGSLVTNDFFPVNDADPLRVNVDLRSTVAAVRNIVRVEWFDVSQISISNTDAYDSTVNPLTFTTQNLVVAPPAGARFARLRLIGIDPSVALAGSTFFDRLSVFYPAVVTGVFDNITIQNNEIITTNLNGDLNLRPNGSGAVSQEFSGLIRSRTATAGAYAVRSDGNTDAEARQILLQHQDGTDRAVIGHLAAEGTTLEVRNQIHDGNLVLSGEEIGGAVRDFIFCDPGGSVDIYRPASDTVRIRTGPSGSLHLRSDGDTDTESRRLVLQHQDGTDRAFFGHFGAITLNIRSLIHGANILIAGENAGGSFREMLQGNPDGALLGYHPASDAIVWQTASSASGGLEVNNTLTGAGFERVLTTSDLGSGSPGARKPSGTSRTSVTVPAVDPDLALTLSDVGFYEIDFYLFVQDLSGSSNGIRIEFITTGVGSDSWWIWGDKLSGGATPFNYTAVATLGTQDILPSASGAGTGFLHIKAFVNATSANATIGIEWAQENSNATALRMDTPSACVARFSA